MGNDQKVPHPLNNACGEYPYLDIGKNFLRFDRPRKKAAGQSSSNAGILTGFDLTEEMLLFLLYKIMIAMKTFQNGYTLETARTAQIDYSKSNINIINTKHTKIVYISVINVKKQFTATQLQGNQKKFHYIPPEKVSHLIVEELFGSLRHRKVIASY